MRRARNVRGDIGYGGRRPSLKRTQAGTDCGTVTVADGSPGGRRVSLCSFEAVERDGTTWLVCSRCKSAMRPAAEVTP